MRENMDIVTHTAPTTQPEDTSHAHSKCAGVQGSGEAVQWNIILAVRYQENLINIFCISYILSSYSSFIPITHLFPWA